MLVAYLRRSKEDVSGLSLAAQLTAIRERIGEPDQIHQDEGLSGARADRPGLIAALEALKRGDTLAVYRRDRLARDTFLSAWIDKEASKRGAAVVSATEDGTNGEDPASRLLRDIVAAFAGYERAVIGSRTKAALAELRAQGKKTGGDVPYGHQVDDDGTLVPDPDEQKVIAKAQAMRAMGHSLRQIGVQLEDSGVRSRSGRTTWKHPQQVQRVLSSVTPSSEAVTR
jgi:DNA invertase Pin-like site-specific DNA recombinase